MADQIEAKISFIDKIINEFKLYTSNINWFVFILMVIFSWGGWIDIFGIWSELPLMVNSLPEGWRLPSILTGAIQIGQIGSLFYLIFDHFIPGHLSLKKIIFLKLIVSTSCTFALSFNWNKTFFLFGEERSVGLLCFIIIFAICDGFSTISTIPYIMKFFKKEYIIPYYIGEAMFALIPSIIAIIQGVGDEPGCTNVTIQFKEFENYSNFYFKNDTILKPLPLSPIFSISSYFIIIFCFLLASLFAFIFLNYLSIAKNQKEKFSSKKNSILSTNEFENPLLHKHEAKTIKKEHKNEKFILLTLNFVITFFFYGILPGVQSYSTLPYGNFFLPIAIFLSVWSLNASLWQILSEFFIAILFTIYIIFTSLKSPCPPFLETKIGPIIICSCWILSQSIFMRVRCMISSRLEIYGEKTLMISGSLTLLGEVVGGIFIFILVERLRIFEEKPECVFDYSYCRK